MGQPSVNIQNSKPIFLGQALIRPLKASVHPMPSTRVEKDAEVQAECANLQQYWNRWLAVCEQARQALVLEKPGAVLVVAEIGLGLALLAPEGTQTFGLCCLTVPKNGTAPVIDAEADDHTFFDVGELKSARTVELLDKALSEGFPDRRYLSVDAPSPGQVV